MLLVALKGQDYDNRWRKPGEIFDAAEPYASALVRTGMAKMKPPEEDHLSDPDPVEVTSKRHYKRRDMVPIK